ncbi:hypothetical protein [Phenylobacterium sp.]|uniref:hypothetical protein n=1 Tax=Phenylobacterium sp. TaxID=1871053 RepID=UPI003562E8E9
MRAISILIAVLSLGSASCASPGGGALPVCDGKHLRPGNPHGSVLDPAGAAAAPVGVTAPPADHPSCGQ